MSSRPVWLSRKVYLTRHAAGEVVQRIRHRHATRSLHRLIASFPIDNLQGGGCLIRVRISSTTWSRGLLVSIS